MSASAYTRSIAGFQNVGPVNFCRLIGRTRWTALNSVLFELPSAYATEAS